MDEASDTIEINIHIPKTGIFFLGNCIRYVWDMSHRFTELLPLEKALLDGAIDIEYVVKSFTSFHWMNDSPVGDTDCSEERANDVDEPPDKVDSVDVLEAQVDVLEAQVEELEARNERLVDLIDDLYRQLEMAPAIETGVDMLPSDMSEDDTPF